MRRVVRGLALVAGLSTVLLGCSGGGADPGPSGTPMPSPGVTQVGKTVTVVQRGADHTEPYAPPGSTVTTTGESVQLVSTRDAKYDASVEYVFDPSVLPAGSTIKRMDVAVCGWASGDFWEFYGPDAEPFELEVTQPDPDGCWHFSEADGTSDLVTAYVYRDSRLRIDRLIWTITLT